MLCIFEFNRKHESVKQCALCGQPFAMLNSTRIHDGYSWDSDSASLVCVIGENRTVIR